MNRWLSILFAACLLGCATYSPNSSLSRVQAEKELQRQWNERLAALQVERGPEMQSNILTHAGKNLRWLEKTFGEPPVKGHSLWISMHGGGNAPAPVNNRQWSNQIRLYNLEEGIYVAPRGPSDTWNLWHEAHVDPMFDRLIEDYIALRGVDPNRIYLMGYSAGGDGVWQLSPRMADRFAAASMMAGHPNEAQLFGLRNLPFAIFMGGADAAYDRNKVAAEKGAELDKLQAADPGGYVHMVRIYDGLPHWMSGKDAESIPWMAKFSRNPWPQKIVWFQDDVTHTRFYWLALPTHAAKAGQKIIAEVIGQKIQLNGDVPNGITLRLSDELLNLDQSIQVFVADKKVFEGRVSRTALAIQQSLAERADPRSAATATLKLNWP